MGNEIRHKRFFLQQFLLNKYFWLACIFLGLIVKAYFLPLKTGDYVVYLKPWIDFIKAHGYFSALQYDFSNYTPAYLYFLTLVAKIPVDPVFVIKIFSIFFEFLAAYFLGKIICLKYHNSLILWISLAVIPWLPTVMLNSSYLSQCDAIYASFVVGSIFYALKNRQFLSVLLLGVAFAFKMQAVFVLPFFFVLLLRKEIKWYYFLIVPAVYVVSILPAWFFGRSFVELISLYFSQAGYYRLLTMNFPNIYIWFSGADFDTFSVAGILFTVLLTLTVGFWLRSPKITFTIETWIKFIFLSFIVIPFILPGMHERYMYLADIFGLVYLMFFPKKWYLPLGILLVSTYSYIRCSRFNEVLPMQPAFFVYLLVIVLTFYDFVESLKYTEK
jgi:Gpi18-like mannosyltransferase